MKNSIIKNYKQKSSYYFQKINEFKKKLISISILRFIIFLFSIISLILLIKYNIAIAITLFTVLFGLFIYLIIIYIRIKNKKELDEILQKINDREIKCLNFNYSEFENGIEFVNNNHFYTYDLDTFGENSLFQYLNRTSTEIGKQQLANWLINPPIEKNIINERQQAIKELKDIIDWRQQYQAYGKKYKEEGSDKEIILKWLNDKIYFSKKSIYSLGKFIFPFITIASLILAIIGYFSFNNFFLIFIFNITYANFELKKINQANEQLERRVEIFKKYSYLLKLIESKNFKSGLLIKLKNQLWNNKSDANTAVIKLSRLLNLLEGKNNLLANVFINGFFSWNIYCLIAIEKWKITYKEYIPKWFDTIQKFDAYCSLANFAYNNNEYCYPKIDQSTIISAKMIGHPLLKNSHRINNDFIVKKSGDFIIITGPNMAGKSTFLRTIGVNLILARLGAPVCAEAMSFKPLKIYTSMRTNDSLSKNESYFLAELNRFKKLFELINSDKEFFVILDEILRGTNIQDKQKGSKVIIEKLIINKVPGIIATHDLTISDLKNKYPDNIFDKSFEIDIEKDKIIYSYKLKNGISKKMNAMILMKQLGITINT